jgi:4-carboxymuconolactone decarboxylase
MPPIPRRRMTARQRQAVAEITAGPRGGLIGPFIAALRSPELMRRLQKLGEYLRFDNALGPRLTEFLILLTARSWTQQFEWTVHAALAARSGLGTKKIAALAVGRRPAALRKDEAAAYDFFKDLETHKTVRDATYARAVAAFGEAGVVDMIALIGYYTTLAMILNVARTPLPPGSVPELGRLPRR